MRTCEIQNGEGDVNHERISVPGVRALGQQHPTSFKHYESAWRIENTGSKRVGVPTGGLVRPERATQPSAQRRRGMPQRMPYSARDVHDERLSIERRDYTDR